MNAREIKQCSKTVHNGKTRTNSPFATRIRLVCVVIALLLPALCSASTIVVGLPADSGVGNSFPFGGGFNGEYQQVYTSSLFSGPITITGLDFFDTEFNGGGTALTTGTFTISLSTTSADWDTLSTTLANNIGANDTEVFSGSLAQAWAFGDTLSIAFSTPFTYAAGPGANLLLDVVATGTSQANGVIFFDTNGYNGGGFNGDTIFGRARNIGGSSSVLAGYGLVTGFVETGATPEPATLALFGVGLTGLGIVRFRRTLRA